MPDADASVVLDHDEPDCLGQMGRQTARVVDGATGNEESHRAGNLRLPTADRRGSEHFGWLGGRARVAGQGFCLRNVSSVPREQGAIELESAVRRARNRLPRSHRALLDQINAQDLILDDWPGGVLDLYRTIRKTPPLAVQLEDAAAAWLEGVRVVAYNGALLRPALAVASLDAASIQSVIDNLAWHEYGHALSATRATADLRSDGPRLLDLLPPGIRRAIDYPGGYARRQVFDEVIANVYPLMIGRAIQSNGYGAPPYLHSDVFAAFQQVVPWPPAP